MTDKAPPGFVTLTPALMDKMGKAITERNADAAARYPALIAACDYETRLAITAAVFKAIVEHAGDPGTFRYLIYERLGFGPDAYLPLYNAGGMVISNEFDLLKGQDAPAVETVRVPVEPTDDMIEAGHAVIAPVYIAGDVMPDADDVFRAMVKAVAKVAAPKEGE